MKYGLLLLFFSLNVQAQTLNCGATGCVPASLMANVQEKAAFSSVDLGFNSLEEPISILSVPGNSIKAVRVGVNNGSFPGKSFEIDLSSKNNGSNAGDLMFFSDNVDVLNIKMNGYSGTNGTDASQLCATRITGGQYGEDVRLRFLQRRSDPGSGLTVDKCVQADVDDLADSKFTCDDPSFTALDKLDPKINLTRVRKNSRCLAIAPQNICVKKSYTISCSFKLGNYNPYTGITDFWETTYNQVRARNCEQYEACASWSSCFGHEILRRNGTQVPFNFNKSYTLTQDQLNAKMAQGNGTPAGVCKVLVDEDAAYNFASNVYSLDIRYQGKRNYNGGRGCYVTDHGMTAQVQMSSNSTTATIYNTDGGYDNVTIPSNPMFWNAVGNPTVIETSPGLDSTLQRLSGGTPFTPSPNGNSALRQTNSAGWQLEIMPAFFEGCNANFQYLTTQTDNLMKTLYDPNQFNNNSSYCIDRNNPLNCSAPPLCDNPNGPNCKKISACEQINRRYCLDVNDSTNCSKPPFCDDPLGANCSSDFYAKSCDPSEPLNSFCDKDPNNLAQYQLSGLEPDPFKNLETLDCGTTSCPVSNQTAEATLALDTLTPGTGQGGTLPGQALMFVYNIRSVTQQANSGQAGRGGLVDIVSPQEIRYCARKRDFTTDPNTQFENDPQVIFKKIFWRAFNTNQGGAPGSVPPFSNKSVEIYKKIDPATNYILRKELM